MSTDDDTLATLKIHKETSTLVAAHEPETLALHLKSLYNRFHGGVEADWFWIAHHFKREANDTAAAKSNENPATSSASTSAAGKSAGNAPNDAPAASQK